MIGSNGGYAICLTFSVPRIPFFQLIVRSRPARFRISSGEAGEPKSMLQWSVNVIHIPSLGKQITNIAKIGIKRQHSILM